MVPDVFEDGLAGGGGQSALWPSTLVHHTGQRLERKEKIKNKVN